MRAQSTGEAPDRVVVAFDAGWQPEKLLTLAAAEALRRRQALSIVTLVHTPADDAPTPTDENRWTGPGAVSIRLARIGDDLAQHFPTLPVATHCLDYRDVAPGQPVLSRASLLVIGARDLHGHLAFAPDSASNRFLAAMGCPVLTLTEAALAREPRLGVGQIVAALSGEASDSGVGEIAAREALRRDDGLHVVHSLADSDEPLGRAAVRGLDAVAASIPALPAQTESGGVVDITLTREPAVGCLLRASRTAHLIVLGSRAGSLTGAVMGSVSRTVVASAQCPVLVVRAEDALLQEQALTRSIRRSPRPAASTPTR
ncbi:universal stress protein [Spongisporangium articulatum]|uniref:Universal stress protein n=1 Tax=Spongisporangium articulatum TaxID=3362603 RepID=A0ABW8ALX8_9ACTN